jgi:glycosyltransferase involved in cell wall biosynthesis
VVGDGPHLPELKSQAKQLGINASFWGWVDNDSPDLKDLYETSRIFAFTSDQENFPINLLEAMCAGNAIITTDSSGTREVVGDAAILVGPQDPAAIAAAIERLSDDAVAEDLSKRARERICEKFSWDVVTTQYENTMRTLIERSGNR